MGIEKEISIFLQAILAGNLLLLVYMALNVFRKLIRHNLFWISLEDLLYWGFAGIYIFLRIQETSSGNIRWYFVLGLLGGSLTTYYFLGKIIRKYVAKSGKTE